MNKWLKGCLVLFQIGGGLLGIGLIGRVLLAGNLAPIAKIVNLAFIAVFAFGVLAGVAIIKKPKLGLILSLVFQGIQIPVYLTPALSYVLSSGAFVHIFRHETGWGTRFALLGSRFYFYINGGDPRCVGVNIVALVLFIFLIREIWFKARVVRISEPEFAGISEQPPATANWRGS